MLLLMTPNSVVKMASKSLVFSQPFLYLIYDRNDLWYIMLGMQHIKQLVQ